MSLKACLKSLCLSKHRLFLFCRNFKFSFGSFVQVTVAKECHSKANGGFAAFGEDVVEGERWNEYEVACFGVNGFVAAFNDPVDFAFEYDPPFVVVVDVVVVCFARFLADDCASHVVEVHNLAHPVWWAHFALDFFKADAVEGGVENGVVERHLDSLVQVLVYGKVNSRKILGQIAISKSILKCSA